MGVGSGLCELVGWLFACWWVGWERSHCVDSTDVEGCVAGAFVTSMCIQSVVVEVGQ